MIDVARETRKFKPIDLNCIPGKYAPTTDQMYDAFVQYNKALHQLQLNKEDAAKNYLRRATALFPDFYEANMVLGILVFAGGDRIAAVRIFNSVSDSYKRAEAIKLLDHLVEEAEKPETLRQQGKVSFAERHNGNFNIDTRKSYGRATEREVLGMNMGTNRDSSPTKEARYSKGQIFEQSKGNYEPQNDVSWNEYVSRPSGRQNSYTDRDSKIGGIYSNTTDVKHKSVPRTQMGIPREANYRNSNMRSPSYDRRNSYNDARNSNYSNNRPGYQKKEQGLIPKIKSMSFFKMFNNSNSENDIKRQLKDANDIKQLNKYLLIIIAILIILLIITSTLLSNKNSKIKELEERINSQTIATIYDNFNQIPTR